MSNPPVSPTPPPVPPPAPSHHQRRPPPQDGELVVTHRAVYFHAALVMLVATLSFVLGAGFGGLFSGSSSKSSTLDQPCHLVGNVQRRVDGGTLQADPSAIVILLPKDALPDEKMQIAGLEPSTQIPPADHPTLIQIRSIGGSYTRTDVAGRFVCQVGRPGNYFGLVLSKTPRSNRSNRWNRQQLTEIGRYFEDVPGWLAKHDYHWEPLKITPGGRWDVVVSAPDPSPATPPAESR